MSGAHSVQGETARKIIEYICDYMEQDTDKKLEKLRKKLTNKGKISLKFAQLPDTIIENINAFDISVTSISNAEDDEITEYFRYLQNQERLRAGEIINSIPSTDLEHYLAKIEYKEAFLRILGFPNERRQFDRAFFSVLGLLDGILTFGALDKEVVKYASDFVSLQPEAENQCIFLIDQINYLTSLKLPIKLVKANVRFMKFFLFTAAFGLIDYFGNTKASLIALDSINKKLSSFASAKAGEVERVFNGYGKEVIEEHRLLALIAKGGHSYKRTENRMKILAYYVNNCQNKIKPSGIIPE